MRDRWKFYESRFPYFMTCTVVGWLPVFTRPAAVQIIADSWKYLQQKRDVVIFGYVIVENHLHWIAQMPDPAVDAGDFKSFTARRIIDLLRERNEAGLLDQLEHHKEPRKTDRQYQLWQEGSHPEQIQNEGMLWQKLEYMHNNPVKRGYVADPTHWLYSSARNYAKLPALIELNATW
jgi:REP element-mobilizing transposase RayT